MTVSTRRVLLALLTTALALATTAGSTAASGGVTGVTAGVTQRLADMEPPSTPVPILTPEGRTSAYVVNGVRANGSQAALLRQAVRRADGVVVAAWPQIGVVVAHSTSESFRTDVLAAAPDVVASAGATRTVAVTEGTPRTGERTDASRLRRVAAPVRSPRTPRGRDVVRDPREAEQWDLRMIGADRAHQTTDGSRRVVVGVLDSGIDADHPDLQPNLDRRLSADCTDAGRLDRSAAAWQPTSSDHGTHVAGTVAAARNGVGVVGVAPGVRLASVKVVNDRGLIYPEYAVCGFMWAGLQGMDVTNNSYYVDPFMFYCGDQPDQAAAMTAVDRAVRWSHRKGVAHVAAAGNASLDLATVTTDATSPGDGTPVHRTINSGCLDLPAELDDVVTVSSYARVGDTLERVLSAFSNRGYGVVDVAAPGSGILSTVVAGNGYGLKSGTSMAAPHVAGVVALMASAHPGWSPARLAAELESGATDVPCAPPEGGLGEACVGDDDQNSYAGGGMVDAEAAVR